MNLTLWVAVIAVSLAAVVAIRIIVQRALDREEKRKASIDYNAWVAHIEAARQTDFDLASDELQDRIDGITGLH